MALRPCRECKKEVSTEASACPHCGATSPTAGAWSQVKASKGCVAILIAAVVIGVCVSTITPNYAPPIGDAPTATSSPPPSSWSGQTIRSQMDGSVGYHAEREADAPIEAWLARPTPRLAIRCRENKTDVYVHTQTAAQPELGLYDRARVRLRFDDGTPQRQVWTESTDDAALFAPNPIALARRIANAKSLRFEFTPFNAPPAIVTFSLDGAETRILRVADACGWTL